MSKYEIIADSGSTKTDWVIVDENAKTVDKIRTIGFNPYFHSTEFIFNEIFSGFSKINIVLEDVENVNFYGAGCSSKAKNQTVEKALARMFSNAKIHVDHDLIAAARASLGNKDGIACIIGTGSNSCVWENGVVTKNIPSHGYIYGDEGSGSYLGIELVKLYLEDRLGEKLRLAFKKEFKLSKEQILNSTYKEKDPNVFLAHFASFYRPHLQNEFLKEIVYKGFDDFFQKRVIPYDNYKNYELGFIGSIAYFHKEILSEVAKKYGMSIANVNRCPIDALVEFHSLKLNMKMT